MEESWGRRGPCDQHVTLLRLLCTGSRHAGHQAPGTQQWRRLSRVLFTIYSYNTSAGEG